MRVPRAPETEATSGRLYLSQREGKQESSDLKMKRGVQDWCLCELLNGSFFLVLCLIHFEDK